ncbi:MAG: TRAP transporter substrate-binding protein [Sulfolobales archaeon]
MSAQKSLVGVLVVLVIVAGVGGYFAGSSAVPPPKTITTTVTGGAPATVTTTVTTRVTEVVTVTVTATPSPTTTSPSPTPTIPPGTKYTLHVACVTAPNPCDLNPYGECDPHTLLLKVFKSEVEKVTGGAVQVVLHPAGELGDELDNIEMLRAGDLFMATAATSRLSGYTNALLFADYPGLFRSLDEVKAFSTSDVAKARLQKLEELGLIGVGFSVGGTRYFITIPGKAINSVDDLKGMKIRVMPTPIHIEALQYLGASPISMPYTEVYTALQTRAIDGLENEPPSYLSMRFYEVAPNYALLPWFIIQHVTLISKKLYSQLPSDIQKIVMDAAIKATNYKTEFVMSFENRAIEIVKERGANITRPDPAPMFEKLKTFIENNKEKIGLDVIQWLEKYRASK